MIAELYQNISDAVAISASLRGVYYQPLGLALNYYFLIAALRIATLLKP